MMFNFCSLLGLSMKRAMDLEATSGENSEETFPEHAFLKYKYLTYA